MPPHVAGFHGDSGVPHLPHEVVAQIKLAAEVAVPGYAEVVEITVWKALAIGENAQPVFGDQMALVAGALSPVWTPEAERLGLLLAEFAPPNRPTIPSSTAP